MNRNPPNTQYILNLCGLGLVSTVMFLLVMTPVYAQPEYVGAGTCQQCHTQEYNEWRQSHHFKAMQIADKNTVLGDFSDITVNFHDIDNRLYQKGDQFMIDTINAEGEKQTFPIRYTFGFSPLQQYLVELSGGRLQALNVAWDSRDKSQGGQRWFHLQPEEDISPDHPFFWAGHFQNWNGRCAECHVTNYEKGFDSENLNYQSQWSEGNVACEACHGPASNHVDLALNHKLTSNNLGFSRIKPKPLQWQYQKSHPIAQPSGEPSDDHINMCGGCHSRRMLLSENTPNHDFHDGYLLELLQEGTYFPDGQVQDEVFVMGSFLQSKMHQNGVTCHDCHNPHTGKVKIEGNGLCGQCHLPTEYDTVEHHHHPVNSAGAQCVNCHMPARTFMRVDDRRDHSFTIPRPSLSEDVGVPNACTNCHDDKNNTWAESALTQWGVKNTQFHWAHLNQRSRDFDVLAGELIVGQLHNEELSTIVQATLTTQLGAIASPMTIEVARKALESKEPLVRRSAVTALASTPPQIRWQLLSPYITDTNRQVRFMVATALAELLPQLPPAETESLRALVKEYREMLSYTADFPSTQMNLANLETSLGNRTRALKAYQKALTIDPNFVPALINLSEFYRRQGKHVQAKELLTRALKFAPDSATVQYAFGLQLIRERNYKGAIIHLAQSLNLRDAQPRHAYVYAVAQDSIGDTDAAIETLLVASERWPNQVDLLSTLVLYMDKVGQTDTITDHLSTLQIIAPNSPQVLQLLQKYQNKF